MAHGDHGGPPSQWSDDSYGRSPGIHPSETWTIYGERIPFTGITYPTHDPVTLQPRHGPHFGSFQDDVHALAYYGSFGLLDVKMPFEAFALRRTLGVPLMVGAGISMAAGIALAATVGWAFDPADKREGGIAEWDWDTYSERRKFG